jgi:hypothetical protein
MLTKKEFQLQTNFFYKGYNLYGPHGPHAMFVAWCSSMPPTIYIDKNMIISHFWFGLQVQMKDGW